MAVAVIFFMCICARAYASRVYGSGEELVFVSVLQDGLGDSLTVFFRQNVYKFEPEFRQNGARCAAFVERLEKMRTNDSIQVTKVQIYSSASPEGRESLNENLAKNRAESVLTYLHKFLTFEDKIVSINPITEDWETLADLIEADSSVPSRQQALDIIMNSSDPDRKAKLMNLGEGKTWNYVYEKYFPQLRAFRVYVYIGIPEAEPVAEPAPEVVPVIVAEPQVEQKVEPQPVVAAPVYDEVVSAEPAVQKDVVCVPSWNRQITVKTNVIGWAMLGANIAVEADIIPHLSFALPFHYSGGLDYFKETIKFRGIVLQPEVRWYPWLSEDGDNDGFYVGAHFGLGWYNFALDGEWRYQDHKGRVPSYGGGLSLGYATQFKKNPRWGMEFGVGGGVYKSKYDVFFNEHNGPYYDQGVEKIWFGVDNVTVSFTYKFDVKKGGRK